MEIPIQHQTIQEKHPNSSSLVNLGLGPFDGNEGEDLRTDLAPSNTSVWTCFPVVFLYQQERGTDDASRCLSLSQIYWKGTCFVKGTSVFKQLANRWHGYVWYFGTEGVAAENMGRQAKACSKPSHSCWAGHHRRCLGGCKMEKVQQRLEQPLLCLLEM